MRFVKGISLFFIYPAVMFGVGYFAGVSTLQFFYPGSFEEDGIAKPAEYNELLFVEDEEGVENQPGVSSESNPQVQDVVGMEDTLNADTAFVIWEADLLRNTLVETVEQIPGEYIGLNREQFLVATREYEMFPPLSEMEKGFVSLDVVSFSVEQVVVQMNYQYIQPSESFHLAVQDNEVVVLLEDKKTVFINTGIQLEELPESLQLKIIQILRIENEEVLYDFLENYSS